MGTGPLSYSQVQELARKQAVVFRLPAAQKEKSSWWSTLPSLVSLRCGNFLPPLPTRIQGPRDVQVVRHDETVTLIWACQWCTVLSGAPQGIPCGTIQDLHRCLSPLIERDDLLSASMLEVVEEDPVTSLNPAGKTGHQVRNQNSKGRGQPPYMPPNNLKKLLSLRKLAVWE